MRLPYKFKLSNHTKYDGKIEPNQWLHICSQSIELSAGDDDIKVLYFPWHSTLCLSPGLRDYELAPLILRDNFSANSVKIFMTSSPTQVLRTSLELASKNQMKPSNNIITNLLSYEPKSMISQIGN